MHSIEIKDGITHVSFHGTPDLQDFFDAVDEVLQHGHVRLRLWDLANGMELPTEKIRKLAEYAKLRFSAVHAKVAIVAPDDLSFGLTRVYDVYREDSNVEQMIFRNKEQAISWLKEMRT